MKCQNMKIADVLFFIVNLITIYSTNVQEDIVSPQSTPLENELLLQKKLDKDCPYLSKIIRDNNLTNYTIDCKMLISEANKVNVENVLQEACFAVRNILYFMCDSKSKVTPDLFKLDLNTLKVDSICPFNFSHVEHLDFKFRDNGSQLVKELTSRDHCSMVCNDLYSVKPQCAVLSQLNNYLRSQLFTKQTIVPIEVNKFKPEHSKPTILQKVESSSLSKNDGMEKESTRSKIKDKMEKDTKNETSLVKESALIGTDMSVTKLMKEEKTEKILTSVPKEEGISKADIKLPGNENFTPADDEFKSFDQNEDLTNEDDIGVIAASVSDRSDVGKIEKISASPHKGREIYPADRFFQAEDSHFFFYFLMASSIIVVGYLAFHNKNKILAYALEGSNSRRSRRRPNPARYRKLETNLEEAISSSAVNSAASNVVY